MENENRGGSGFVGGLLIGALAGGAIALLLAQEEMRDRVIGKAREAGNMAVDASGDLRGTLNDVTTQWQSGAADLYERGRQVVENARANINGAIDEGISTADQVRDDLQNRAEG